MPWTFLQIVLILILEFLAQLENEISIGYKAFSARQVKIKRSHIMQTCSFVTLLIPPSCQLVLFLHLQLCVLKIAKRRSRRGFVKDLF